MQQRAEQAETRVQVIVDQLPDNEERVRQIPRDIDTARKDIRDAHSQVGVTHRYTRQITVAIWVQL